jgi:hypothetical protein
VTQPTEVRSQKSEGRGQKCGRRAGGDEVRSQKAEGRMQKYGLPLIGLVAVALVVMLGCAKKMLPPSPDRFAPRLQAVETRTRSQVALIFDEDINGAKLKPDSFLLTGPAGETIALRGASLGRNSEEVQLWTPIQEVKLYEVRGIVWDRADNKTRFRARFRGSSMQDTIAPRVARIEPAPGSPRQKRGVKVRVTYSEAIDTSKAVGYLFVPVAYDTGFKRSWSTDWQTLNFTRIESLPSGAVVYLLVQPGARDLEGNLDKSPAFTYFTSDTIFDGVAVKGRAVWPGMTTPTPASLSRGREETEGVTGAVFFTESASVRVITDSLQPPRTESLPVRTTGLAPMLSDGSFATKLRKGEYEVIAVADTNGDGLAELVSPPVMFNTDAESLNLSLETESLPQPINAHRR